MREAIEHESLGEPGGALEPSEAPVVEVLGQARAVTLEAQPSAEPPDRYRRKIVPTPHRYSGGVRTRNTWSAASARGIEISGAVPLRTTSTISFATSSGSSRTMDGPVAGKPSVGEKPGFTLVTRIPFGPSSWYRASLNATTACLVAP